MSERERTGERPLHYSRWHRTDSLRHELAVTLGAANAHRAAYECSMIDLDSIEYCRRCRQWLALVETQRSAGPPKPAPVTLDGARRLGIPAYSLSYRIDDAEAIIAYRVTELTGRDPMMTDVTMAPYAWAAHFHRLHSAHACERST